MTVVVLCLSPFLSLHGLSSSFPSHLSGGHPLLYHEVGCHDGRGAGEPQEARDEHLAAGEAERAIDEVGARLEMLGNVGLKEVMLCQSWQNRLFAVCFSSVLI